MRSKSASNYLNQIFKPSDLQITKKAYARKMADTAICKAEEEILSEIIPVMEKVAATFDDFIKVFPAMKNESIFAEVKDIIRKYSPDDALMDGPK